MSYTVESLQRALARSDAEKDELWRRIEELQRHLGAVERKLSWAGGKSIELDNQIKMHRKVCPLGKGDSI